MSWILTVIRYVSRSTDKKTIPKIESNVSRLP